MGILNVTPDSFSDGGQFIRRDVALRAATEMYQAGATWLDIGGESTRPHAPAVSLQQELDRVLPLLEAIKRELPIKISIDTCKTQVMQAAVDRGVDFINDVNALQSEGALAVAAKAQVKVCVMHRQGQPQTMQDNPHYVDVVAEVKSFLAQRATACLQAGIKADNIYLDAGFGFGKTLDHNLRLMRALPQLAELGYPLLVGVSRKSMMGQILDKPVDQRLYGGLALAAFAWLNGASVIRTHDVAATMDVLKTIQALQA
jgi:dihydropteroate synthase